MACTDRKGGVPRLTVIGEKHRRINLKFNVDKISVESLDVIEHDLLSVTDWKNSSRKLRMQFNIGKLNLSPAVQYASVWLDLS